MRNKVKVIPPFEHFETLRTAAAPPNLKKQGEPLEGVPPTC